MTAYKKSKWSLKPWHALVALVTVLYILTFLPLLITAAVSFNGEAKSKFPPVGFSTQWWVDAFDMRWLHPLVFSIEQSVLAAGLATLLGVPLAIVVFRYRFPGRQALLLMSGGPLILPALITGIALLQFVNMVGANSWIGLPALVVGYGVVCIPFVMRTTLISLNSVSPSIERAAASLGATPSTVLRRITFPVIKDGIVAGAVFSFIQSFTDYSLGLFLSTAEDKPIPIAILNYVEFGFTPTIAAVAVISMIVPVLLVYFVQRAFNVGEFIYGDARGG
jgi:putative spermidine/putrescine transport system permease protein